MRPSNAVGTRHQEVHHLLRRAVLAEDLVVAFLLSSKRQTTFAIAAHKLVTILLLALDRGKLCATQADANCVPPAAANWTQADAQLGVAQRDVKRPHCKRRESGRVQARASLHLNLNRTQKKHSDEITHRTCPKHTMQTISCMHHIMSKPHHAKITPCSNHIMHESHHAPII